MKWKTLLLVGVVCLFAPSSADAVDWKKILCTDWCRPLCLEKSCCDDYRGKPMPCVPRARCSQCDDYRCKCEPCTKRICSFLCDDYCYKCPPVIKCPSQDHLKCAPTATGTCACGQADCPSHGCKRRQASTSN